VSQNNIKVMKSERMRLDHEKANTLAGIKDNTEKIKMNKQLPYLVANVVEVIADYLLFYGIDS